MCICERAGCCENAGNFPALWLCSMKNTPFQQDPYSPGWQELLQPWWQTVLRSHVFYFPVCLHVVPVINNMALSPKRSRETGEGGYLNKPMTTVTQTKALDRREWKIAENKKRREQGPCMYSTAEVGGGSKGWRERGFKWRVGKRGGGASPVLISCCLFTFSANPETQTQLCALQQQAPKKPPVSLKLKRAVKCSLASEVALLDASRYIKDKKNWFICEQRMKQPPPPALTPHAHQFLRQPAS